MERLPSAQVVTLESWDRVPQRAPCMEPASPPARPSTPQVGPGALWPGAQRRRPSGGRARRPRAPAAPGRRQAALTSVPVVTALVSSSPSYK